MQQDITFFAKTNFRNQNVKFGIKTEDRQRHIYVIGKTGMGKTTLLENIVMQDIANGYGVAYIDPHGDTAEKLIKAIPANRINDVVYFNPADTEYPVAFNILEAVDEDKKYLVASGMMGVFKKIWPDVWSARMEYILNNAILALLDYPGSTMMGVNRMMSDKKYRQRVYEKIKDPIVKSFWIDEFETWDDRFRKEAVAAIQNKVGQFLSSFLIRNIVGQTKSTINMRDIMEENKILIVNLSKGRIGEDAMRLLGGMIVTKLQLAAMERVDIPEEKRSNFYLTVDEFQNFVTESFANILSEARKYRLNLLVAHQYINQLVFDGNTVVRDAIFGNVGTIIAFRVGAEDAEFLEKEFEPIFMMNDIVNLPKYNIYLKLMIDGIAGNAFSATALPPIDIKGTEENAEKVIRISRERYARIRKDIEDKISRWTGMIAKEDFKSVSEEVAIKKIRGTNLREGDSSSNYKVKEKPPSVSAEEIREKKESIQKKDREQGKKHLFQAECATCGIEIGVPFKPDGERPTFCKDCLKDYQRAIARLQNEEKRSKEKRVDEEKKFKIIEKKEEVKKENIPDRIKSGVRTEQKIYVSKEKPMSLSQTRYVAPKKIKNLKQDMGKIKELINRNRKAQGDIDKKN
ncbi:MAG: type IV secretion system DNA-binding domain-containing protein [Candidatus Moranbacteria bacterium]|jgi:CxxC-x17-CxxC domain-containing protein|nr:type IV secretion system DNA-binding domain-containing protein [Candidatus Moranbacteria bacterium]MDX9855764.1 type IV secretion system DNA-binding domain-containing protein [Candidatus Moranbacteria bacterium]